MTCGTGARREEGEEERNEDGGRQRRTGLSSPSRATTSSNRGNQRAPITGMQRPDVRDVADVALEERDPARRVQRLEHERAAGRSLWNASSRNRSR